MRLACGSDNAAFIDEKGYCVLNTLKADLKLLREAICKSKGSITHRMLLAAAAAAHALGCSVSDIARALVSFMPLEHRIEPCGSIEGIECYNDSKATNVDATLKALAAFGKTTYSFVGWR